MGGRSVCRRQREKRVHTSIQIERRRSAGRSCATSDPTSCSILSMTPKSTSNLAHKPTGLWVRKSRMNSTQLPSQQRQSARISVEASLIMAHAESKWASASVPLLHARSLGPLPPSSSRLNLEMNFAEEVQAS
eukprot:1487977-Rhodomonas_salina.1